MRIFLGLTEIAGYYNNLAKGFRQLGHGCDLVEITDHDFRYSDGEAPNSLVRLLAWLGARRRRPELPRAYRLVLGGLQEALKLLLLAWAVPRYDVFIFGFHSSFARHWDLPLLKALGKTVISVYHGSDSRPPYLDGSLTAPDRGLDIRGCIAAARRTKRTVRFVERYANVVVDHPPSSLFHERPFVAFLALGVPQPDRGRSPATPRPDASSAIRILHAPSHPQAKGTPELRRMIARLRARGHEIEWIEITGQPHRVVVEELQRCDFVVDQLYSDTPMAGFAAEAAAFGKPAVIGGYYAESLPRDLPAEAVPPSLYCHPDRVEEAIERLILDGEYRRELGERAHAFVTGRWSVERVAERFLRLIEGKIPEEWVCQPDRLSYVHGCGLSEARLRELLRGVVREGGVEALQLRDKPQLEAQLLGLLDARESNAEAVLQG